jgi:Ribosomal protein L7/L12 C-terminal domain
MRICFKLCDYVLSLIMCCIYTKQESKELVEGVPKLLKKDLTKDEAVALLAKMKELGAECSMD